MADDDKSNKVTRGAPAFQMYAPDRLSNRTFKAMSAAERGLLHTIELECWVNGNVPADMRDMARTLGMEQSEVNDALTQRVKRFLELRPVPEPIYIFPELEKYRSEMIERRERMKSGGKEGAEKRWRGRRPQNSTGDKAGIGDPIGDPNGPLSGAERSSEEQKGDVFKTVDIHKDFIKELEGDPEFMSRTKPRKL